MLEPQNIHKLKSLQGHLAYVHRFISSLTRRCRPFNQLMKKDVPFEWNKACKNAFKIIKENLTKPPMLRAFVPSQPLIIYIATQERSYGSLLAQKHDEKKEKALYYLSWTLIGVEINYSPIKKLCLALFFSIKKLRHYVYFYLAHLISKADPIKYIMSRPLLSRRLEKWSLLQQEFEIIYIT